MEALHGTQQLSLAELQTQLATATETNLPKASVIQLVYFLQTTNAAVAQVGACLGVLTKP